MEKNQNPVVYIDRLICSVIFVVVVVCLGRCPFSIHVTSESWPAPLGKQPVTLPRPL